jgi:hypothetical protein
MTNRIGLNLEFRSPAATADMDLAGRPRQLGTGRLGVREGFVPAPWMIKALRACIGYLPPLCLLLIWQGAAQIGWLTDSILPEPLAVAQAGARLLLSGELAHHVVISFSRAIIGLKLITT